MDTRMQGGVTSAAESGARLDVLRFADGEGVVKQIGNGRLYTVLQTNVHPWPRVALVEGLRAAQILARILSERCPDLCFSFGENSFSSAPICEAGIRETTGSGDVRAQVVREMQEEKGNFNDQPKWIVFFYDRGMSDTLYRFQYSAYLEHDTDVVRRCLTGTTEVFRDCLTYEEGIALLNAHVLDRSPSGNPGAPFVETVLLNKQLTLI